MGNDNNFYKTFMDEKIISELCDICIDKNIQFDKCDYEFLISKMEEYENYKDDYNFHLPLIQSYIKLEDIFKYMYKDLNAEDYTLQQVQEMVNFRVAETKQIKIEKFEQEINKLRTKFSKEELEYIDSIYILEKLIT